MIRAAALLVGLLVLAALLGATRGQAGQAQNPKLFGSVGPGFSITLRDAQGNNVTSVDPGTYDIEVRDLADMHTFHLRGPGVDERTQVEATGTVTWTVTFQNGDYAFFCDVHPQDMRGTFTSGNAPAPQPPPPRPPPRPPGAITAKTRLQLTSGPREVIRLRTAAGRAVTRMRRGTYTVVVRDRSRLHNAHIVAPGFNRRTTVGFRGTQRWRVPLRRVGTLRFLCDVHPSTMRGAARIVR
ncbi:MAG: cupredoxin domain-containing protein [Gaiellaceae bacterium]